LFSGSGSLGEGTNAEDAKPVVLIGDAGVSERLIRICLDGFLVTLERFGDTDLGV
jgi:hypothetical protein